MSQISTSMNKFDKRWIINRIAERKISEQIIDHSTINLHQSQNVSKSNIFLISSILGLSDLEILNFFILYENSSRAKIRTNNSGFIRAIWLAHSILSFLSSYFLILGIHFLPQTQHSRCFALSLLHAFSLLSPPSLIKLFSGIPGNNIQFSILQISLYFFDACVYEYLCLF